MTKDEAAAWVSDSLRSRAGDLALAARDGLRVVTDTPYARGCRRLAAIYSDTAGMLRARSSEALSGDDEIDTVRSLLRECVACLRSAQQNGPLGLAIVSGELADRVGALLHGWSE